MIASMELRCADCGEPTTPVRARFEIRMPLARLILEEVPAVRCAACEREEPADHVRAQLDAVIELVQEMEGVTARKDFSAVPLRPGDPAA